jgi:hypothetical protein
MSGKFAASVYRLYFPDLFFAPVAICSGPAAGGGSEEELRTGGKFALARHRFSFGVGTGDPLGEEKMGEVRVHRDCWCEKYSRC